jgi:cold-inducible RNA-binding protein
VPSKIYVGNLSYSTTEDELRDLFAPYGEVVSVSVVYDRATGRPRGFAFVEMGTTEAAQGAISGLNGQEVGGRQLRIDSAKPPGGDGRGGGGRGGFGGGGGRGGYGGGRDDYGGGGRGGYDSRGYRRDVAGFARRED